MKYVADEYHEGENVEDCMIRETMEEGGITIQREQLKLFTVRSNSRTDTRAHVTNVCFYAELTEDQLEGLTAGDDIKEYHRLPIQDIEIPVPFDTLMEQYPMAFNHLELMVQGVAAWREAKRVEGLEAENKRLTALVGQLEREGRAAAEALFKYAPKEIMG
jgi:ADP-ribose pyrophosphatase YjhB (NUDIX family)